MKFGRVIRILLLIFAIVLPARGVETTFWQVGSFDEFLQGTLTGVSLSKEGDLTLAPEARTVFSPEEALALSLARDSHGNIFVGTGHQGKVFRVTPDGKSSLLFTAKEPDIFTLAVEPTGDIFVGTSPEGKVYRVTSDGKSSVFFDPKAKYIWALQFDSEGRLYVATGDKGQIYRVDASGKGDLFFDSKQTHVMCLALDPKGNLLAGSVPNGLIYRISPDGKAFVIYQASLPEIHDLAVDSQGNIFAAAMGGAGSKGSPELLMAPSAGGPGGGVTTVTVTASADLDSTAKGQTPPGETRPASFNRPTPQTPALFPTQLGGGHGALIEIHPDSTAETAWSSNSESIFGLAVRSDHVLFTTDVNGRIFDLYDEPGSEKLTLLTETHESITTRLLRGGSDFYAATGNVAKLFRIESSPAREGTFESPVKDTKFISRWGVLAWRGDVPAGCTLKFFTRSGNSERPDNTWSDWAGPLTNPNGEQVTNPPARYLQWKAVLHTSGNESPTLDEVTVAYLNQNLPPQIHSLNVSTSGERTGAGGMGSSSGLSIVSGLSASSSSTLSFGVSPTTSTPTKTPITLTWQADDPNGDQLIYSLYLKGTDEREWHLLKDKIHQSSYTLDPTALADGKYIARLVASDEESNPPSTARKSELLSAPFWVDNTPPDVEVAKQSFTGDSAIIQFTAEDSTSPLRSAETSLDGHEWHDILSDDGIVDSRKETFSLTFNSLAPGEHIVALRAYDTSGNVGVGKAVIEIPGGK